MINIKKPIFIQKWVVEVCNYPTPDKLGTHEFGTLDEANAFCEELLKDQKAPTGRNTTSEHNIIYYMRNMESTLETIKNLLVDIQENTEKE